jgi:UTP--glucose-1-phosphate uridylyltransferase
MNKKVRKAVFPAAGMGTRFLPATKSIPKEMLSLVDKPLIQYGVEEAIASGCDHIIIITARGKSAIEDHFDLSPELDALLESRGKKELLAVSRYVSGMANISFVRQKEAKGLGHAVLMAKDLVGDEPFAVMLPDDIIDAQRPCLKQMIEVFEQKQSSILATMIVEGAAISAYGVLDGEADKDDPRLFAAHGMVEKPKLEAAPSKNAIIGRYVLTPRVFEMLEHITPGAGGELQLTDGIKGLLDHEKVYGFNFEGKRYDAGDKSGMLEATVDFALKRPDLGPALRAHLKSLQL